MFVIDAASGGAFAAATFSARGLVSGASGADEIVDRRCGRRLGFYRGDASTTALVAVVCKRLGAGDHEAPFPGVKCGAVFDQIIGKRFTDARKSSEIEARQCGELSGRAGDGDT